MVQVALTIIFKLLESSGYALKYCEMKSGIDLRGTISALTFHVCKVETPVRL